MTADNATLVERIELDATLVIFRIRPDAVPPDGQPWFTPGQYVTIGVDDVQRAYSIASEPGDRRWLEFYIRFARDPATESPLTHLLWKLPLGARLHIGEKIVGRFTLERTVPPGDARVRLLVAAGTGVAPFVGMMRHARRANDTQALSRLAILHGASHPHELAYRDELTDAAARFGLRYMPTVSRPAGHPEWTGLTGRVESLLDGDSIASVPLNPTESLVYVCGFRDTIAGSVRRLLGRGFLPEERRLRRVLGINDDAKPSLFWEQYDPEPIFDVNDQAVVASLKASMI
jgi:ferredoxin--NADP+ reductase